MRSVAAAAIIAAALIAGLFAFVARARAVSEVATFQQEGVCIEAPNSRYGIESSMPADFYLVDVLDGQGRGMRVYIGGYPELSDEAIRAGRNAHGAMTAVPGTTDQFIAVRPPPDELMVHVMLGGADTADRGRLLNGIRFCAGNAGNRLKSDAAARHDPRAVGEIVFKAPIGDE